jgi:SAM-dependent methyltransferase
MDVEFSAYPTSFLPPLIRISSQSAREIATAIHKLKALYWPPKPPPLPPTISLPKRSFATRIHDTSVPDSGYASAEEDEDDVGVQENITHVADPAAEALHVLRADPMERAFAVKWITGFIARSEAWCELAACVEELDARTYVLDDASALLAAFSTNPDENDEGVDEAIVRSFCFPSPEGSVVVELNDAPLLDDDHTSVGLQSWGSSIRLGERLCAAPAEFSLATSRAGKPKPLRILELGAGTGLLSILAAKILGDQDPFPVIVATDYHPDVLENLKMNVTANFPFGLKPPVAVHVLDWEFPVYSAPLDTRFDIILAADVIYEDDHARWIKGCVERLLVRPSPDNPEGGVFWMIMALREAGHREGLDGTVHEIFPDVAQMKGAEAGLKLAVLMMEEKEKIDGIGRADETGYKLFKVKWVDPSDEDD